MKRTILFLMAAIALLTISCNKDDDIDDLQPVQSVSFIPEYSDGTVSVSDSGTVSLKCVVTPLLAVKGLEKDNFKVLANYNGSEGSGLNTLPAFKVETDESLGIVTVSADLSSLLEVQDNNIVSLAVNISSDAWAYTSPFVNVYSSGMSLDDNTLIPSVKQVEMTVVVPIHPSSLEYFNYIVRYSDNRGKLCADTVRYNGIEVEDYTEEIPSLTASNNDDNCYVRTHDYDDLPVTATVTVEMVPRKESSSMVSFNFYTPKPYIFPNVHYSTTSVKRETPYRVMDGLEQIMIDNMSIGSFQAVYGTTFLSRCGVYNYADGYEYFFY